MTYRGDDEEYDDTTEDEETSDHGLLDVLDREFKYATRLNPKGKDDNAEEDDE